jgi:uncharacterized protein (DUF736 family)
MIKDLMIFKAKEKNNDKSPDFDLVSKINDKFTKVGAGWNRKTKDGKPFISLKLSNPFKDLKGFHLTEDGDDKVAPLPLPHQELSKDEELELM